MTSTLMRPTAINFSNSQATIVLPALPVVSRKPRFIARWLKGEDSKLYCQWVVGD